MIAASRQDVMYEEKFSITLRYSQARMVSDKLSKEANYRNPTASIPDFEWYETRHRKAKRHLIGC